MTVKNGSSAQFSLQGDARPNDVTSGDRALSPGFFGTCSWLPFPLCLSFHSSLASLIPSRGAGEPQQVQVDAFTNETLINIASMTKKISHGIFWNDISGSIQVEIN